MGSVPATPELSSTARCSVPPNWDRRWAHEPPDPPGQPLGRRPAPASQPPTVRRSRGGSKVLAAAIELQSASLSAGLLDPQFYESRRQRIARRRRARCRCRRERPRTLLAGGGLAVATAAAGVVIGDRLASSSTEQKDLLPVGATWTAVARLSDLPKAPPAPSTTDRSAGSREPRGSDRRPVGGLHASRPPAPAQRDRAPPRLSRSQRRARIRRQRPLQTHAGRAAPRPQLEPGLQTARSRC